MHLEMHHWKSRPGAFSAIGHPSRKLIGQSTTPDCLPTTNRYLAQHGRTFLLSLPTMHANAAAAQLHSPLDLDSTRRDL